jgi:hypothetical protein
MGSRECRKEKEPVRWILTGSFILQLLEAED